MKHLILILTLATGEETRDTIPAHECYRNMSEVHEIWARGLKLARDSDGAEIIDVACDPVGIADVPSEGPCEVMS